MGISEKKIKKIGYNANNEQQLYVIKVTTLSHTLAVKIFKKVKDFKQSWISLYSLYTSEFPSLKDIWGVRV